MIHDVGGPSSESPLPRAARVVTVAAAVQSTGALPMFLTGALAVEIQREFGFGAVALGAATGGFVLARALASPSLGYLVDRVGARQSMKLSAAGCGLAALAVAVFVQNWTMLMAVLVFAGGVHAISQPAANRFVVRSVPATRLGLAFGLKQSGPPVAVILAGLAVPMLALVAGWRSAFVAAAVLAALTYVAIPRRMEASRSKEHLPRARDGIEGLGMVMVGMAFSLAATNATHTFIVGSGVAAGLHIGVAGLLLSMGGVVAIVVRISAGIWADRLGGGYFWLVARMLLVGAVGYILLATDLPALFVLGTALVYGATWGMNGVLFMAIVRRNRHAPAAASGNTIAAASVGGFCGPPIFGFVVEAFGYPAAWIMTAGWVAIAAITIGKSRAAREEPLPK